ncbi:hypothetical protein Q8A67_025836 [Cirrhinus molitorella]|uniref:Uncharacterized protein n=1 Tax=Cirrhinus molitorella TaxID=172907 RepID=A0AA88TBV0_9TELE|nr:hypothetical protein Q8A67_025836 [Cirrhinus molitorella]
MWIEAHYVVIEQTSGLGARGELGRIAVDFSSRREEDSRPIRWKDFSAAGISGRSGPAPSRIAEQISAGRIMKAVQSRRCAELGLRVWDCMLQERELIKAFDWLQVGLFNERRGRAELRHL